MKRQRGASTTLWALLYALIGIIIILGVMPASMGTSTPTLAQALNIINNNNYVAWAVSGLASKQVPYATGANTLAGDSNLTYESSNGTLNALYFSGNGSLLTGLPSGSGDMEKATYDANDDGVIDVGALGGGSPSGSNYLRGDGNWQPAPGDMAKATYDANADDVIDTDSLGTGTPNGTKYLRDDGTWQTPSGSGDMTKAAYDADENDYVDAAEDIGRAYTYTLAAADSPAIFKLEADIVCDGTADNSDISGVLADNVTINLSPGSYNFATLVTISQLTDVTITGYGAYIQVGNTNSGAFTLDRCANTTIKGLDIDTAYKSSGADQPLIKIVGSTSIDISENTLHDASNCIWIASYTVGGSTVSSGIRIQRNEIYNYWYAAVLVRNGVEWAWVEDNDIHDGVAVGSEMYGIATETPGNSDTTNPFVEHLNIIRNYIRDQDKHEAIETHGGNYITVSQNHIENISGTGNALFLQFNWAGGSVTECHTWHVEDNTVSGVYCGIVIAVEYANLYVHDVDVVGNTVEDFYARAYEVKTDASGAYYQRVNISINIARNHTGSYAYADSMAITNDASGGTCCDVNLTGNILEGNGDDDRVEFGIVVTRVHQVNINGGHVIGADTGILFNNTDNSTIGQVHVSDAGTGINLSDGDNSSVMGTRIYNVTTPMSAASGSVNPLIMGNNWAGCTNDISVASATNERLTSNIDKTGAWYGTGDDPG